MTTHGADMTAFLDSNIVLYALGDDDERCRVATALIEASPWISTQVINECSHVLRRKLRWSPGKVAEHLSAIVRLVQRRMSASAKSVPLEYWLNATALAIMTA